MVSSLNYTIEQSDGITRIEFRTQPTLEEAISVVDQLSVMDNASLRLWHLPLGLDVSMEQLEAFSEHANTLNFSPSRVAFVAGEDPAYGLLRMQVVFRETENVRQRVFRTLSDAIAWLHSREP